MRAPSGGAANSCTRALTLQVRLFVSAARYASDSSLQVSLERSGAASAASVRRAPSANG